MRRIPQERMVRKSVFDRLVEEPEAEESSAWRRTGDRQLRRLKASICRDLHDLLNTKWRFLAVGSELPEVHTSLMNYGLPDFFGSVRPWRLLQEELRLAMLQAIRSYEPRLGRVQVELVKGRDATDRTLHFRVDAVLLPWSSHESVAYYSVLDPRNGVFSVEGGRR